MSQFSGSYRELTPNQGQRSLDLPQDTILRGARDAFELPVPAPDLRDRSSQRALYTRNDHADTAT